MTKRQNGNKTKEQSNEIKDKIKKKCMEANENENRIVQNLWDASKVVIKREVY